MSETILRDPFMEGYAAALTPDLTCLDNPYPAGSDAHKSWEAGYWSDTIEDDDAA